MKWAIFGEGHPSIHLLQFLSPKEVFQTLTLQHMTICTFQQQTTQINFDEQNESEI